MLRRRKTKNKEEEKTPMYPWTMPPPNYYGMPPPMSPVYIPNPPAQQQSNFDPIAAISYFDQLEQISRKRRKEIEAEFKDKDKKDSGDDKKKTKYTNWDYLMVTLLLFTIGPIIGAFWKKVLFLALM